MIVLEIDSVKEFMQHMFQGSMFDRFHLRSCEVTTFATFHIDGRCFDDWFDSDEKRTDETGLVTWNMMKTFVFSRIKISWSEYSHFLIIGNMFSELIAKFPCSFVMLSPSN